jgi:hypothetical protein
MFRSFARSPCTGLSITQTNHDYVPPWMYAGLNVKCPLFLSSFNRSRNRSTNFSKHPKHPLFHTDRQTDNTTRLIIDIYNFYENTQWWRYTPICFPRSALNLTAKYRVITAVMLMIHIFWDVTLCGLFTLDQSTRRYIPTDLSLYPSSELLCRSEAFGLQQPVMISNFSLRIALCYTLWRSSHFPSSKILSLSQYSYVVLIRSRTDRHLQRLSGFNARKTVSDQDSANHATVATCDKWPRRAPLLVNTLPWQPALRGFFCFS